MRHGLGKDANHGTANRQGRQGRQDRQGTARHGRLDGSAGTPIPAPFVVLGVLGALGALGGAAPCRAAELLTTDGVWVEGPATSNSGGGRITVTVGGKTVPVDRIVALRFSGVDPAPTDTVEKGMAFVNGDLLAGILRACSAGKIVFLSESFGRISPAASSVLAFSFTPRGVLAFSGGAQDTPGAELVNGDFVRGEVVFVNREAVGVLIEPKAGHRIRKAGRRVVKVPRERTALVRLGIAKSAKHAEDAKKKTKRSFSPFLGDLGGLGGSPCRAVQIVRLVNGDRLTGELKRLVAAGGSGADRDVLEFKTAAMLNEAGTVKVPPRMVVELWSEGGPLVPVSTMTPVEVVQTPQFDESFPHGVDRSPGWSGGRGSFLSVGGKRFERGLGCHSRCEIEYDLAGGFLSFLAEIGIDDSAPRLSDRCGQVVFKVLVDGDTAFDSGPVRAGEPPRTVRVPVRGAKRMRLVVGFGPDGSSVGDHADWGRAVLVRR